METEKPREKEGLPKNSYAEARVLLAEDNKVNQIIARHTLEKMGLKVEIAKNGIEAVQMASDQPFDLILMDVQMPEMNGLDATREIRVMEARNGKERIPIVAMTANAMAGDREMCIEAGMDDYISKPFSLEVLRDTLAKLLA